MRTISLSKKQLLFTLLLFGALGISTQKIHAHGSMEFPLSRTLGCYLDSPTTPASAACQDLLAEITTQIYRWDMLNQLPGAWIDEENQLFDKHKEFVPDGTLCSGNRPDFSAVDAPRTDWPVTPLIPNENGEMEFVFNATVPHKTNYFHFYMTKDSYDYSAPLTWDDLESDPFCTSAEVPLDPNGIDNQGYYRMNCPIPTDKQGMHIVYMVWQRPAGDSAEAFYGCSDVVLGADALLPTPTPAPAGSCVAGEWKPDVAYEEGASVLYNGIEYIAGWWTKGNQPGSGDFISWTQLADCTNIQPTSEPEPTTIIMPTDEPTEQPATETPTPILPTEITSDMMVGDVNCDEKTGLVDVVLIQRFNAFLISGTSNCTEENRNREVHEPSCDINDDGQCSLIDAIIILQCNAFMDNLYCSTLQ